MTGSLARSRKLLQQWVLHSLGQEDETPSEVKRVGLSTADAMEASSGAEHEECGATRGVGSELAVDTESTTARRSHRPRRDRSAVGTRETPAPQESVVEKRERGTLRLRECGAEIVYRRLRR
jgi:hypothetical protein